MEALFTLVRGLARREDVRNVAAPKWLVQRHALGPLAARAGSPEHREALARAAVHWAKTERALPPIIAALRTEGIRVVPIKGVDYATRIYSSPSDRPMSDVDLLVRPHDLTRASRVLHSLGLSPGPRMPLHHAIAHFNGDLAVDLHWSIIGKGRSTIDHDAIWSRTSAGWPEGAERLDATDALLFHLVHMIRNRLRAPLVSIVDYSRLREQASLPSLSDRSRAWGLQKKIDIALAFCSAILEGEHEQLIGWPGPTPDQLALLETPTLGVKIAFDVMAAGSSSDVLFRGVQATTSRVQWAGQQLRGLWRRDRGT